MAESLLVGRNFESGGKKKLIFKTIFTSPALNQGW